MTVPSHLATLLNMTGQRMPIIQAPIGSAATQDLVTAVCSAGRNIDQVEVAGDLVMHLGTQIMAAFASGQHERVIS